MGIRVDNILKSVELLIFFLSLFILLMKYVCINTYVDLKSNFLLVEIKV